MIVRPALPAALALALGVLLQPAGAEPALALEIAVDSRADLPDSNLGDTECRTSAGTCTLRAAIQNANKTPASDTIVLGRGVFALKQPGRDEDAAALGDLDIREALTIRGEGAKATIVDGRGRDRVFDVAAGTVVRIEQVTIRGGDARSETDTLAGSGGGIRTAGDLTLEDVTLSGNTAERRGGGVHSGGSLTADRTSLTGNRAGEGGGLYNVEGAGATLDDVRVNRNRVEDSGAGIDSRGTLSLTRSTLTGNRGGLGGGLLAGGTSTLTDVSVVGNRANQGGGIYTLGEGNLTIQRSTISRNRARQGGGGLRNHGATSLTNSTISGNRSRTGGGALHNEQGGIDEQGAVTFDSATVSGNRGRSGIGGLRNVGGSVNLRNTIVANNSEADCEGTLTSQGHLLIERAPLATCAVGGDQTGTQYELDPALGPLRDNGGPTKTHALRPGSPAIDTGPDAPCPAVDQRVSARPRDGDANGSQLCDKGALSSSRECLATRRQPRPRLSLLSRPGDRPGTETPASPGPPASPSCRRRRAAG
jgi:hypothetical protein